MNFIVLLLLMCICLGIIYMTHKYLSKTYFYLIAILYSIVSYLMSFKVITIFGIDFNASIIFTNALIILLYYFINKYKDDTKKFIYTVMIGNIFCLLMILLNSLILPSIYDNATLFYKGLVFDSFPIIILYPISLFITLFLSNYCYKMLKEEEKLKDLTCIFTLIGISFINSFIFVYFSYAFIIKFDTAIMIALGHYFINTIILIIYYLFINMIIKVRKVK